MDKEKIEHELKMKSYDEQIAEIDRQLKEMEEKYPDEIVNGSDTSFLDEEHEPLKPREPKDQSKEAIETIKECVNELLEIEDLKASKESNPDTFANRLLTIVSWFNYLKKEKKDSNEFKEASDLIRSIGNKHEKMKEWCNNLVDKELKQKEYLTLNGVELNVNESNVLTINDRLKIEVDSDQVKDFIENKHIENKKVEYKVVADGNTYNFGFELIDGKSNVIRDDSCPYNVNIENWTKTDENQYIIRFGIMEKFK